MSPRATMKQASDYCKKDGDVFEMGELPPDKAQGKRSDLERVKSMMDSGAAMKDVAMAEFSAFVKYFRGFQKYQTLTTSKRSFKSQVIVITGDPGTFKSYSLSRLRGRYHVVRPTAKGQGCWYDGYEPGKDTTVVYDDFTGGWMPYHNLLELTDRYACLVQSKGGTIQFRPLVIGFTSNYGADQWYPGMDYAALERRIDQHYTHVRADADNDAKGIRKDDIIVTKLKGQIQNHPLYDCLKRIPPPPAGLGPDQEREYEEYKLTKEFQDELADTQYSDETVDEFWKTMYRREDEPDEAMEPELSEDVQSFEYNPDVVSLSSDDDYEEDEEDLEGMEMSQSYDEEASSDQKIL